jgi:preprotein translocase subunit SecG
MMIILYTLIVLSCLILIGAVLLQPAKGGGISALGGTSQSVFGSTGGTTFLFRTTMVLAAIIMTSALLIARYGVKKDKTSVTDSVAIDVVQPPTEPQMGTAPATPPATAPVNPAPSN